MAKYYYYTRLIELYIVYINIFIYIDIKKNIGSKKYIS